MAHRPRWLSLTTAAVTAVLVISACSTTAPATTAPSTKPASQAPSAAAPSSAPSTAPSSGASTGPSTGPSSEASEQPSAPASEPASAGPSASAAPQGTPYPSAAAQPGDPSAITNAYPNYGTPVDCEAGEWNGLPYTGNLQTLTAPDDNTVVFTFCKPDVAFLSKIAFSVFAVNDSAWLIQHTAAGDHINLMNGTGPYKLDKWQKGTEIDYTAFDGYWGDKAVTTNAVLRWQGESAARLQELQAGTIDGMTLVGPTDFATVEGDANLKLQPAAGLNTLYLGMNHDFAPWDNDAVRKAIEIGIDRQRIVDNYLPPGSEVATHFTPCAIPFACEGDDWPATDVATARQMITDAVGEAGITTTLAYRNVARGYLPLPVDTATDLQAQLEAINIHVTLDEQQSSTYIANSNTGKLTGLFLLGWGADYPDVTNFLDYHFGAGCTAAFGKCYPAIADPLTTGGQTADEATRKTAYAEANNALIENVPMVPISHAGFANAYLAGVTDQQISPLSNELLFKMGGGTNPDTFVFMQNGEPGSLYCADESDGEALRACEQSMEGLYGFEENGTAPIPLLATGCTSNEELTVWTCTLREGVKYHDGSDFTAQDVIVSLVAQWDALSPLHKGATGAFSYWPGLWGGFLNPPAPCGIEGQPACAE
jgi:peptide/nickel transport system substrate-binding protein